MRPSNINAANGEKHIEKPSELQQEGERRVISLSYKQRT